MKKNLLALSLVLLSSLFTAKADIDRTTAGAGNPLLPGYFADPTIVKFGDIYYIYATTDNEMLASGAPTLWYSKDLQNWYNYIMDVPSMSRVKLRNFWAPDILKGKDNRYYLYFGNCQMGCNIYGYVSETPFGPWKKLHEDDKPIIPNGYPRQGFPSLDAQFFQDNDGKIYSYWGTWVHYNGGYAVGQLNPETMDAMFDSKNIPLEQTPKPFEAAYMLKHGSKYILMYSGASCHDETYNVRYSYSDSPYGPFKEGTNNPVLSTNEDKTVHGPGHHSVIKIGEKYYIVYHRHDHPFTRGGMARQVCIDEMIFDNDSTIRKVVPTHQGIPAIIKSDVPADLAFKAQATASSVYHLLSPDYDYQYLPSFATDNNNSTMWKASSNSLPQNLVVDLGQVQPISRVMTQFEFSSYYYQYLIEYSADGKNWKIYADRSENRTPGSPMIDDKSVSARYIRLTVLATEKEGLYAAVWNIKVYGKTFEIPLNLTNKPSGNDPAPRSKRSMLVYLDAAKTSDAGKVQNFGTIGGIFSKEGDVSLSKGKEEKVKSLSFENGALTLEGKAVPQTLAWNGAFTVAVWVKNPGIQREGEVLFSWCDRQEWGLANSYNALCYNSGAYGAAAHLDGHYDMRYKKLPAENQWHHIVLTFDGVVEKVYVDGVLDNAQNMLLSSEIAKARIIVGSSDIGENFSGSIASLRLYDYGFSADEIKTLMIKSRPKGLK